MLKTIFEEMAQVVVAKLDEKPQELADFRERWLLKDDPENDMFTFVHAQKVQSLAEMARANDDIYSKWFIKEVDQINNFNDTYRIWLMSAVIAYLAFIEQSHEMELPDEFYKLQPLEIFYNIYITALKTKGINALLDLGVGQE